ncbi:MAG: hypothetical protein ABSG15_06990 [FCB group bacterium]|jgi:hypothetical protein
MQLSKILKKNKYSIFLILVILYFNCINEKLISEDEKYLGGQLGISNFSIFNDAAKDFLSKGGNPFEVAINKLSGIPLVGMNYKYNQGNYFDIDVTFDYGNTFNGATYSYAFRDLVQKVQDTTKASMQYLNSQVDFNLTLISKNTGIYFSLTGGIIFQYASLVFPQNIADTISKLNITNPFYYQSQIPQNYQYNWEAVFGFNYGINVGFIIQDKYFLYIKSSINPLFRFSTNMWSPSLQPTFKIMYYQKLDNIRGNYK